MLGPEGVVELVAARLNAALPGKLGEFRTRYGTPVDPPTNPPSVTPLPDWYLMQANGDPPRVFPSEPNDMPVAAASFPLLFITELRTDQVTSQRTDVFGRWFTVPYPLMLSLYARGTSFDETRTLLRRFVLAVREVLLQLPMLTAADAEQSVTLDVGSWNEQYGSPTPADGGGIVMGCSFTGVWVAQEYSGPAAPLGVADGVSVVATRLPFAV